jgi:hypothetical protein
MHYRLNNCPNGYNAQQCIVISSDTESPPCTKEPGHEKDPLCYPLAIDVCKNGRLNEFRGLPDVAADGEGAEDEREM